MEEPMDDIYEYLKLDHKKVANLFKLYETSFSEKNKLEIVELINKELTVHALSEEETLYKLLEQHSKSKKDISHSEKEHEDIKNKLAEIIKIKQANKTLDKKVKELKNIVEHHVSEEEGKIFRKAKDILTKEEAYIIKEKMHALKGKILLAKFSD
jgi:hemerythrin superfamily protein